MAKYNSLGELFTAIANSIRAKTGGTDPIAAEDFPTAVEGIEVGSGGGSDLVITDARYLFYEGARLDLLDVLCSAIKNCTSFRRTFYNCSKLTSLPELDTSSGTDFSSMFASCYGLASIPELDTSSGTDFSSMFSSCNTITSVPELDTSSGIKFIGMFTSCTNLTSVPKLDVGNAGLGTFSNMFYGCLNLTSIYLYNIKGSIKIGSGTSWGHRLTVDSLVHTIKELCTVTTAQTLTMGSANLEKIAGLYCKITDDTVEKKTMELCESTDEGAMTLSEYAAEKGWELQ